MSVISDLPKNKRILVFVAIAAVLVAGGYLLFERQPEAQVNNAPTQSAEEKKFFQEKDKKKEAGFNAVLGIISYHYNGQRRELPPATEDGWSSIVNTVSITDSFMDPYTEAIYTFAEEDPEYGEIQYGPGKACDKDGTFKAGYGNESLALRAKFSDGIRCINNFQG